MKYYFSAIGRATFPVMRACRAKRFLFSFAAHKNPLEHLQQDDEIMIDSGAFSVWNRGEVVDIDDYLKFCLSLPQYWKFVSLDVIPKTGATAGEIARCVEQSKENYTYLAAKIPGIIPVHHYGDPLRVFEWYAERTNYIGVSPANDTSLRCKDDYLNTVFAQPVGRTVRTHAFGYTSMRGMLRFPFYSVDSTSFKFLAVGKLRLRHAIDLQFLTMQKIKDILQFEAYATKVWAARGVSFVEP